MRCKYAYKRKYSWFECLLEGDQRKNEARDEKKAVRNVVKIIGKNDMKNREENIKGRATQRTKEERLVVEMLFRSRSLRGDF